MKIFFQDTYYKKIVVKKVDFDVIRKVILKYSTDLLINMVNDKEDYVAKYIIAKLGKQYRLQPSIEKNFKK